jgi:hypothetical protein
MNTIHIQRAVSALGITAALGASAWMGVAIGHADPSRTVTVDGTDYPVCAQEDCSDVPGQLGVWFDPDTGNAWLSLGEYSVPVTR